MANEVKSQAILTFLVIFSLLSIHAFGLTETQLETDIRNTTTGCPDFTINPPAAGAGIVVNAFGFGISPANTGAQNYTDFVNAIAYCKNNSVYKLIVPKGTYKIGNYGSHYAAILNFSGLHDFIFDGQGSTFLMQSKSDFIHVTGCSRVVLQNYTMNWDWSLQPVQSLVKVVAVGANYLDLYYPYETNPPINSLFYELDEVDGVNYHFSHQGVGIIGAWQMNLNSTTSLGNNTLRYYTRQGNGWFSRNGVQVGQYFLLRHYSYEFKGNDVSDCTDLTFSNVTVYSTLGMGYSLNDNKRYQIIDSKLIREPGSLYHLSSASDGVNISKSYGYFKLINDEIGNCGDDNINIHDGISEGVKINGVNSLIASNCVDWRNPFAAGDIVELRKADYTPWNWSSALTSVSSYSNNNTVKLTFAGNLPDGFTTDSILFNHKYDSGHYIISGCYIHDSKGKGAFLHTANGTVESNQFIRNYNPGLFMASIISPYGSGSAYGEGYNPTNIIVQNNIFDGNNIIRDNGITDSDFPNDIVIVGQTGPHPIVSYPICQNIIFQYNVVKNSTHASLEIASATNVLVENNTFENPCLTNDSSQAMGCIMVLKSSAVIFSNNDLVIDAGATSYKTNIYVDTSTATNNIFIFPFASVTVDAGPPVIGEDVEPTRLTAYVDNTNTFSIIVSGSAPFAYQWYRDGLPIADATNNSYAFAVLDGTNTYYCAVTNSYSDGAPTLSSVAIVIGLPVPRVNPADFSYRMKIQFSGYSRSETLTDFPALVRLGANVPGFSYQQFASVAGGDLRFTDASRTREIPCEINQWNTNGISTVWVQVPALSNTNDSVFAYWGNPQDTNPPAGTTDGMVWFPGYDLVYHLEQTGFPYFDSALQYPAATGISPGSTNGLIGLGGLFTRTPYLDAGTIKLGDTFTLSAWVNVSSAVSDIQCVWANGTGVANSAEIFFYVNSYKTSDGTLLLSSGNGSTGTQLKSAAGAVSLDQWHLVNAVVDRADSMAQLYVDGNQVASGAVRNDFPIDNDMDLGRDTGGSFALLGSLDEARIRSGLSSSNWVWASYMTVAQNADFENYSIVTNSTVTIDIHRSGNNIVLTWLKGTLQSASRLAGPYSDVSDATSPYTNSISEIQRFYRIRVQ